MQEMLVQSLGWGDLLEEETAAHSSFLAYELSWSEEPGRLQSMGSQRVRQDLAAEHVHSATPRLRSVVLTASVDPVW